MPTQRLSLLFGFHVFLERPSFNMLCSVRNVYSRRLVAAVLAIHHTLFFFFLCSIKRSGLYILFRCASAYFPTLLSVYLYIFLFFRFQHQDSKAPRTDRISLYAKKDKAMGKQDHAKRVRSKATHHSSKDFTFFPGRLALLRQSFRIESVGRFYFSYLCFLDFLGDSGPTTSRIAVAGDLIIITI